MTPAEPPPGIGAQPVGRSGTGPLCVSAFDEPRSQVGIKAAATSRPRFESRPCFSCHPWLPPPTSAACDRGRPRYCRDFWDRGIGPACALTLAFLCRRGALRAAFCFSVFNRAMRNSNSDNSAYDMLVKRRALAICPLHQGRSTRPRASQLRTHTRLLSPAGNLRSTGVALSLVGPRAASHTQRVHKAGLAIGFVSIGASPTRPPPIDERCTSIREMLATARASLLGGRYTPLGMQRSVIPTSATQRRIGGPGNSLFQGSRSLLRGVGAPGRRVRASV
jgi:hypothetical protein